MKLRLIVLLISLFLHFSNSFSMDPQTALTILGAGSAAGLGYDTYLQNKLEKYKKNQFEQAKKENKFVYTDAQKDYHALKALNLFEQVAHEASPAFARILTLAVIFKIFLWSTSYYYGT